MKKSSAGFPWLSRRLVAVLACVAFAAIIPLHWAGSARTSIVDPVVRVNPTTFVRGQQGTVTIDLDALGGADGENTLGFSLHFDTTVLSFVSAVAGSSGASVIVNSSQVASGNIGLAVGKSPGVAFPAGTNQVVVLTFTALNGVATSTQLTIGDSPLPRELVSINVHAINFSSVNGTITLVATSPYEADTAPRQTGSGTVVVSDWVQAGRFSVSLDTAVTGSEFQRADCAPKGAKGDGIINVSDWVQAGRFSVNLDPVTLAGGPTSPSGIQSSRNESKPENSDRSRTLSLRPVGAKFISGQVGTIEVNLDAVGDENALGFSLSYDSTKLDFVSAVPVHESDANVLVNPLRAGHLAIALSLRPGQRLDPGKHSLLTLRFLPRSGASVSGTTIRFDDSVIRRQVVSSEAVPLSNVRYVDASAQVEVPLAMSRGSHEKKTRANSLTAAH